MSGSETLIASQREATKPQAKMSGPVVFLFAARIISSLSFNQCSTS